MSPVGHLQFGWWFAHWKEFNRRERAAIALAAAACDLDGLSLLAGSAAYYRYHHILFHNIGATLVVIPLAGILLWRRPLAWFMVVFAFAMHIPEDYITVPWNMKPWAPFSAEIVNLNRYLPSALIMYGFQTAVMVGILAVTVWIYHRHRRTPLEIISPAFDRLIINYAVLPWKNRCARCDNRAHLRCGNCGKTVCVEHGKIGKGLEVYCADCSAAGAALK